MRWGGRYVLGPTKPSPDEQITLARECLTRPPGCWASIGRELKAETLIYGTVQKQGDRFHVIVKRQTVTRSHHVDKAVFDVLRVKDLDLFALWSDELTASSSAIRSP